MADLYELLGVPRDASQDDIKRAYRAKARELHPDANPDDPDAEHHFKEVAQAWEVLRDPEKRARYDRFGDAGIGGAGQPGGGDPFAGFGGVGDIFDAFFGGQSPFGGGGAGRSGPMRGPDLEVVTELDFTEAVFGAQHKVDVRTAVACEVCDATGATPGTSATTCADCGGAGQVRRVRQSLLGQMVTTAACPRCNGAGEVIADPCGNCAGEGRTLQDRSFTVDIPPGVDAASTLRLQGRGAAGPRGGPPGDLYVHFRVRPHDVFRRDGVDLHADLHIPVTQAMLGAEVEFETLDGTEAVTVPPATPTGHVFRFRGKGVPVVNRGGRGDLHLHVVIDLPRDLTEEQEELVRRLAELRGEPVAEETRGFFTKLRTAFK
ncbi:molecular chaperone DnaJ [Acidimicrobiia bacterium EGI L10123]|uniref:molecular chaperone DnaJ n=1 Tax=Salinilacustrithrix flava TaxID=2957203 RepID=UPI003D7C2942|nr:molecular chaperone DnaJ [Acidimicrobiia bacterium EGI L10123]